MLRGRRPGKHGPPGPPDGAAARQVEPRNFEEFIYKVWGAGIAKHFAIPYNRKLWAVPLTEMETSWLGGRVPLPDLEEMIDGRCAGPQTDGAERPFRLSAARRLPGADGRLPAARQDPLRFNARVTAVSPSRRTVTLNGGEEVPYEHFISTMPLPVLVGCAATKSAEAAPRARPGLRYVSVRASTSASVERI